MRAAKLTAAPRAYGGTGLGNSASSLVVQSIAAQAQAQSITLTLPPLATLFLVPQ